MPNYFKTDWLEDWKEERKKGKLRYFLLYGIGFSFACLIFDILINKQDLTAKTPIQLLTMTAIFLGGGFAYSIGSWFYNEYKLRKTE